MRMYDELGRRREYQSTDTPLHFYSYYGRTSLSQAPGPTRPPALTAAPRPSLAARLIFRSLCGTGRVESARVPPGPPSCSPGPTAAGKRA